MDHIFKIPFFSGFGVYEISGTRLAILAVCFFENASTNNEETLKKIKSEEYPSHLIKCLKNKSVHRY